MATGTQPIYNLDTCALLTLETFYPQDVFPQVWEKLDELLSEGRAYLIEEVYKEIEKKDDTVFKWLKPRKDYSVRKQSQAAILKAQEIIRSHPNLVDINATLTSADPFVIADSLVTGSIVVTREEEVAPNAKRPKIPNVCHDYSLRCLYGQYYAVDFFRENGWEFSR